MLKYLLEKKEIKAKRAQIRTYLDPDKTSYIDTGWMANGENKRPL